MRPERWAMAVAAALMLCGCAGITGRGFETGVSHPAVSGPDGLQGWILALGDEERLPRTVKGIGHLTLHAPTRRLAARVAWVAARGGRLRLEILSPAGQPVISLAADGQKVYVRTHADGQIFRYSATDPGLDRFLSIGIKTSHLVRLLMGGAALEPHQGALLAPAADTGGYRLSLKHWRRVRENIYFSDDLSGIRKVEVFDFDGALVYRADVAETKTVNGYRLPGALTLSNDKGASVRLRISRQWADAEVMPSTFVLTPARG
jgi:hypothetical protein